MTDVIVETLLNSVKIIGKINKPPGITAQH